MGVMPFLAACHACVLMLYCTGTIVCYVCSFKWQIKFSLSVSSTHCFDIIQVFSANILECAKIAKNSVTS